MSQKTDLLTKYPIGDTLCRQWATNYKRQAGKPVLSVNDILCCPAKLYFMRVLDPTPSCPTLNYMSWGRENQDTLLPLLQAKGYITRPKFFCTVTPTLVLGISNPDPLILVVEPEAVDSLPNPKLLAVIHSHNQEKRYISYATGEQKAFWEELTHTIDPPTVDIPRYTKSGTPGTIGDATAYTQFGSYFPAYISEWVELVCFDQFTWLGDVSMHRSTGRNIKLTAICRDGNFEDDITSGQLMLSFEFAKEWLAFATEAILHARLKKFSQTEFDRLFGAAIVTSGLLKYYQCRDCPAMMMGRCPGLPPMRKHRAEDDGGFQLHGRRGYTKRIISQSMSTFVNWWRAKGVSLPDPPVYKEHEDYITDQARKLPTSGGVKTTATWDESILWTEEVRRQLLSHLPALATIPLYDIEGLGPDADVKTLVGDDS